MSEESKTPVDEQAPGSATTDPPEVEATVSEPAAESSEKPAAAADSGEKPAAAAKPKDEPAARQRRRSKFPALVRAFRFNRDVEGTIEAVIKGGYEVKLGKARGFCPHSQISLERQNDPEAHVGQTLMFRITQLRRGGEDLVLSRRALLLEQRTEEAKAVRATLIEGAVMQGHVSGLAAFGAFVDLGAGVQGLAHISELSHKRVRKVEDAVELGQTVQVKVLRVNEKTGRISLSIRGAEKDPWADVAERFEIGKLYEGKVVRVAEFGAFVELAPALEALAPASEFPPSPRGWKEGLEAGSISQWQVLSMTPSERRISIALPGEATEPVSVEADAELTGKVQRIEGYGIFVWLGPGKVGLMPKAWCGAPPGTELQRRFSIGDAVEVKVVEIAEGGRKIRLCRKGVEPGPSAPPERETARTPRPPKAREVPREEEPPATFGTSLADKLRAALGQTDG